MSGLCKDRLVTLGWVVTALGAIVAAILLVSGCSLPKSTYEPIVQYALEQTEERVTDRVEELIHEAATKPVPPLPPVGSSWTDYGVWGGSVAMGSLAVLADRRRFHRKNATGFPGPDLRTR